MALEHVVVDLSLESEMETRFTIAHEAYRALDGVHNDAEGAEESLSATYANNFVTGLAFTSSRGWLRWLYTMVSGSMPTLW